MEENEVYEKGMSTLREHHEEFCFREMEFRNNKDVKNRRYKTDDNIKRNDELANCMTLAMWRIYCDMYNIQSVDYCTGKLKCRDCSSKRFNFHSKRAPDHWCNDKPEGWYCQAECECK